MITPPKGDYASVPLNPAARKIADAWDPAKDEAAGEQCKAYGAAAIMRVPGRLHITWENDNTLRVDTDAGTQTRTFKFAAAGGAAASATASGAPSWQGDSVAVWEPAGGGRGRGPVTGGSLKVVTTHLRPGYLRKNGVPYGTKTTLTEYITKVTEPDGVTQYLVVTTVVDDPEYLNQPFVTSTHFKKEPDGAKWNPSACSAR
jgi:hypothetical protein